MIFYSLKNFAIPAALSSYAPVFQFTPHNPAPTLPHLCEPVWP